jgi:hypothetical protein
MDHFKNLFGDTKRPPGASFYPTDMTREEFQRYLESHPDCRAGLESPFTIVRRNSQGLDAIPYAKAFAEWIEPASTMLKEASSLAENISLQRYLSTRADGLLSDQYYESDLHWLDISKSDIEVVIGPYEVYEDGLMGLKTSYEVSIGLKDEGASDSLGVFTRYLEALEENLPYDAMYKRPARGLVSPMVVVSDIFRGGDIATGYQAAAANLPNDPRVHATKGTKKIFWKNVMEARFANILLPLGRMLITPTQVSSLSVDGMLNFVLLHEISHALGARYVHNSNTTVNQALRELYPVIEEGKADVAGLHSVRYLVDRGVLTDAARRETYVSYLASLLRTIRFGTGEAHGRAGLCELNYLRHGNAVVLDTLARKWSINFPQFESSVAELAGEWLTTQATGDYSRAKSFLAQWDAMPADVEAVLQSITQLPADIEPAYLVDWD